MVFHFFLFAKIANNSLFAKFSRQYLRDAATYDLPSSSSPRMPKALISE